MSFSRFHWVSLGFTGFLPGRSARRCVKMGASPSPFSFTGFDWVNSTSRRRPGSTSFASAFGVTTSLKRSAGLPVKRNNTAMPSGRNKCFHKQSNGITSSRGRFYYRRRRRLGSAPRATGDPPPFRIPRTTADSQKIPPPARSAVRRRGVFHRHETPSHISHGTRWPGQSISDASK